ncbi:MAG: hypothetical protein GY756_25720 [bacterium]|nr:hypothetical protein [bacterium]
MKKLIAIMIVLFTMTACGQNSQEYASVDSKAEIDIFYNEPSEDINISSEIKRMKEEILAFAKENISKYTDYNPKKIEVLYIIKKTYRTVWYVTFNSSDNEKIIFRGNRKGNGLISGMIEVSSIDIGDNTILFQRK